MPGRAFSLHMIETIDLPANLPLGGVWQDKETGKLYFRLGEMLLAARVGNVSQGGAALYLVDSLPEEAAAQELPAGYAGAEARRILVCWPDADGVDELVLALDLGRDRYLCFVLEYEWSTEAHRMYSAAACGEIEGEIRHAARFPENVELPVDVVRRSRLKLRCIGGSVALFFSSVVSLLLLDAGIAEHLAVVAMLGVVASILWLRRPEVCPWCGERELRVHGVHDMCCDSCENSCPIQEKR